MGNRTFEVDMGTQAYKKKVRVKKQRRDGPLANSFLNYLLFVINLSTTQESINKFLLFDISCVAKP